MEPQESSDGVLRAKSERSLKKNRWAAEVRIEFAPDAAGTIVTCHVDMAGNKHDAILGEITEAIGKDALIDARGIEQAIERLGKMSRLFARKEVHHLQRLVRSDERVVGLGQGVYQDKQGIVALTDQRLFFFEKSLASESLEEFNLSSISSIEVNKKLTGERLVIHASGNRAEINKMMHGQADTLAHEFRTLRQSGSEQAHTSASPSAPDVLDQIRKLSELHNAGVLTLEEFESKKATLLERL
jgi:hypothetical protein